MIMDSGAEEHVVSLADWKSLGGPLCGAWMVRQRNGEVQSFGGNSSYQVSVFSNETGACWLQH